MTEQYQSEKRSLDLLPSVLLLAVAVLVLASFFLYEAISARSTLLIALESQEQPLQQTQQVKQQFNALASATAKLADEGDVGARQIIEAMKLQGITVR